MSNANVSIHNWDFCEFQVIINTEWGAFGDNGCLEFIMTEYDHEIDQRSINPKKQLWDAHISIPNIM